MRNTLHIVYLIITRAEKSGSLVPHAPEVCRCETTYVS